MVLNFQFRGPKRKRVPEWMRLYIIGYLGRAFCFVVESRAFYLSDKKSNIIVQNEELNNSFASFQEIIKDDSFVESEIIGPIDEILIENNLLKNLKYSESKITNLSKTTKTMRDINSSRNMERLIRKIYKSVDPYKIKDESLKFTILKEILECQRLLLASEYKDHCGKAKDTLISIEDIYDEWRILAMIVDRICFWLYLFVMTTSSVTFYLQEIYSNPGGQ